MLSRDQPKEGVIVACTTRRPRCPIPSSGENIRWLRAPATAEAPRVARNWTAQSLAQMGLDDKDRVAVIVLLASEGVTNAIRAAGVDGSGQVYFRVWYSGGYIYFEVRDRGIGEPTFDGLPDANGLAEGGRGFAIIAKLSDGFGVYKRRGGGHVLWVAFHASLGTDQKVT